MTTEYFTLKEDGVIVWIENMPAEPNWQSFKSARGTEHTAKEIANIKYKQALQSAISNAIKVRNQGEVKFALHSAHADSKGEWVYDYNTPYPLQCHVEKKEYCEDFAKDGSSPFDCPFYGSQRHKTVALVTFPSSAGVEETQEEQEKEAQEDIWSDVITRFNGHRYDQKYCPEVAISDYQFIQDMLEDFTITRKNK